MRDLTWSFSTGQQQVPPAIHRLTLAPEYSTVLGGRKKSESIAYFAKVIDRNYYRVRKSASAEGTQIAD